MRLAFSLLLLLGTFACGDDSVPADADTPDAPTPDALADSAVDTREADTSVADGAIADGALSDAGGDVAPADAGETVSVLFPRTGIEPAELGVIVNDDNPLSVSAAAAYVAMRGIPEANVVHVNMASTASITRENFQPIYEAVSSGLPETVQATVLTWTAPHRVDCMSITSAFAFGFDEMWCNTSGMTCGSTGSSALFRSDSTRPFDDHGVRPAMMLAAESDEDAVALIARGIASDGSLPSGDGYLVRTNDSARSVRWNTFVPLPALWSDAIALTYLDNSGSGGSNVISDTEDVLFYFTGLARVPDIDTNSYRPGAIADHLTSFGGRIPSGGQMSVIEWLQAGATGSYGTVIEPCNYQQKFPNVPLVLDAYFRGATLVEAYWRSVAWPGEGLFVGEPLARPFESQVARIDTDEIVIETNALLPGDTGWAIEGAESDAGPWSLLMEVEAPATRSRTTITVPRPTPPWLRLVRN